MDTNYGIKMGNDILLKIIYQQQYIQMEPNIGTEMECYIYIIIINCFVSLFFIVIFKYTILLFKIEKYLFVV